MKSKELNGGTVLIFDAGDEVCRRSQSSPKSAGRGRAFHGDIALDKGEPKVHAHVVVGKRNGSAMGGHLLEAHVRPTLELVLQDSGEQLKRKFDPESGLALIDLDGK
jgi:hypothetical protein